MGFLSVYTYFIAAALLLNLLLLKKDLGKESYLKLFSPFLLLVLIVEVYASYLASKGKNNVTLLNFFNVVQFCFYLYMLSCMVSTVKARTIMRIAAVVYAVVAVGNILFIQGPNTIHTVTYSLGCLLIVACCIYYFLELFSKPKSGSLLGSALFWICFGLLLFHCISFPLIGLINYWMHISKFLIHNFLLISNTLHIILYSSFTIAFLCRIKAPKYIS